MYSILGWLNALLLILMILPFILVRANKMIFKGKNKGLQSITKLLRKVHKQMGLVLVVTGITHGYLALVIVLLALHLIFPSALYYIFDRKICLLKHVI